MLQKEVAERLCAKPGSSDYGALTAGMSLTCEADYIFELSPSSFNPPPKVKSAVIKLTRRETPLTTNIDRVQRVIQAAVSARRKTFEFAFAWASVEKEDVQPAWKNVVWTRHSSGTDSSGTFVRSARF